jgi:hypothetical membrane protein
VPDVPWWGVASSVAGPVLLIGGWTLAADLQPRFDPVAETVSELAAVGATDRWVMTLTFLVVGLCYVITALSLRPARIPGRLILAAGAIAGMMVAANPEHPGPGDFGSVPHFVWAAISFAGLTLWPAGSWRRGPSVPWALRPAAGAAAMAVLFVLLAWFGTELATAAGQAGLAERVMGAAQTAWPLTVVLSNRAPLPRRSYRGEAVPDQPTRAV